MAATGTPTPNIGLRRPQGTDPASVDDINYNSNLIDTKLGAVGNTSVQEQINSLNSNLNGIGIRKIESQAKYVLIKNGKDFNSTRNPIFCWYTDQAMANYIVFIVFKTTNDELSFVKIAGTNISISSLEYENNDIKVNGFGNWGKGFALGDL